MIIKSTKTKYRAFKPVKGNNGGIKEPKGIKRKENEGTKTRHGDSRAGRGADESAGQGGGQDVDSPGAQRRLRVHAAPTGSSPLSPYTW